MEHFGAIRPQYGTYDKEEKTMSKLGGWYLAMAYIVMALVVIAIMFPEWVKPLINRILNG